MGRTSLFWCCLFFSLYPALGFLHPSMIVADSGFSYRVSIEGVSERELQRLLTAVSDAVKLRDRPPASINLLQERVNRDIPVLLKALGTQGFYAARVTGEIKRNVSPIHVIFRVDTGPPYLLKSVDIHVLDEVTPGKTKLPSLEEIGLELDEPARSRPILDSEQALILWFRRQGFPFPKVVERKVFVDHATLTASVYFQIESGPEARFGPVEIRGIKTVKSELVSNKIPWKEGDRFNSKLLGDVREKIIGMGLFTSVQIKGAEDLDEDGYLPVIIDVRERKHRTIRAGISYQTDEGPGGRVSWEHRNILGEAERLNLSAVTSSISRAAEGNLKMPEFRRSDQALILNIRLAEDRPEAFKSRNITNTATIERALRKEMHASAGLAYRISEIEESAGEKAFNLFSIPMQFNWDTSDELFDPSRGGRLNIQLAPFYDILKKDLGFVKGYISYSRYLRLTQKPPFIFAAKSLLGAMTGADRESIPADIRFYAGGGGSIRGYAFQSVGPLYQGEQIGGRSLAALSSELRIKVRDNLGFVIFLDGGSAFESSVPDFKETFQWGAGAGFRYFTRIGPLRMDVGIPVNPRKDIDASFHLYVSLGQAF